MPDFEIIETKRLILKGISTEVMGHIFDNLAKPEIKKILGHRSEEDYIKEAYKHQNGYASYNRRFLLFLLIEKESGKIIGRCGLHNWNKENKRAEIGYVMEDNDFKRKGLMSEAVSAIIAYGFNQLHLNRIEALVGVGNIPSLKLMVKNNFIQEGVLRQHFLIDDKYEDSVLFSLLKDEYIAQMAHR